MLGEIVGEYSEPTGISELQISASLTVTAINELYVMSVLIRLLQNVIVHSQNTRYETV